MTDNLNTEIKINDIIEVTVTNFAKYGVFTDCSNGYKGLIHISNITNGFVKNAQDYFTINETIKAEVINIDSDNKKLGLSTKTFDLKSKNTDFNSSYSQTRKYKRY